MFKWLTNLRNKRSAEKHGWNPLWFGASSFDERLIEKIKRFQDHRGLHPNGYCCEKTYKLALLRRLRKIRRKYKWTKSH